MNNKVVNILFYFIGLFIGIWFGLKFPVYLHIQSKIFLVFSVLLFALFALMYVQWLKIIYLGFKSIKITSKDNDNVSKYQMYFRNIFLYFIGILIGSWVAVKFLEFLNIYPKYFTGVCLFIFASLGAMYVDFVKIMFKGLNH